jgi:acetyl esterase/lipase
MKKYVILASYFLSTLILAGCTSVSVLVANIPTYFDNVILYKDITFNKNHNLKLDVYIPPATTPIKPQAIVFFYGGSWESGDKSDYKFVASTLARQGYIVFIPNYRKYPDVKFPDFMFDAADAVVWAKHNVSDYGDRKNKSLVLMGHSAGANIATLLVTDKSYLNKNYSSVFAGIGLSGAYDFTPNTDHLRDIFGPPEKYPSMRPITFVDGDEPPIFLGYGLKDTLVAKFNLDHMKEKLIKNKVCVTSKEYPSFDHIDTIAQFSWVGGKKSVLVQDVIDFLDKMNTQTKSCIHS